MCEYFDICFPIYKSNQNYGRGVATYFLTYVIPVVFKQTSTTTHFKCLLSDLLHNQPVGTMGNYQEYLKKMPQPLREVEASPARMHTFGNPFKVNKVLTSMIIILCVNYSSATFYAASEPLEMLLKSTRYEQLLNICDMLCHNY